MSSGGAAERVFATYWITLVKEGRAEEKGEADYDTEDMTFLALRMTRFWTKDLRISGGKIW